MTIQFRCDGCGRLIQTPDSAAGKSAKCPECGLISPVPLAAVPPPAGPAQFSPPPGEEEPLSHPVAPVASPAFAGGEAANPYASPLETAESAGRSGRVRFGLTFSNAWRIYQARFGTFVLLNLAFIGCIIVFQVLEYFILVVPAEAGVAAGPQGRLVSAVVMIVGFVALFLLVLVGGSWIQAGAVYLVTRIARGVAGANIGDVSAGKRFLLRFLGMLLLWYLVAIALAAVVGLLAALMRNEAAVATLIIVLYIGIYVVLLFFGLAPFIIVDQNKGVFESLSLSAQYMSGNALTVFAVHIVGFVATLAAILATCCVGYLFFLPFPIVLQAMVYLQASGQAFADRRPPAEGVA